MIDKVEGLRGSARVIGADLVASALVVGFDVADEEGIPFTQRQRILLIRNALMAWDGFDQALGEAVRADETIAEMQSRRVVEIDPDRRYREDGS